MSISTASAPRDSSARRGRADRPRALIGVEAGEKMLRLVQAEGEAWRTIALPVSTSATPEGAAAERARLRAAGFGKGLGVCALSSPTLDVFPLAIETRAGGSLETQIVARAREQLSYPIVDAVVDYALLPESARRPGGDGASVLVFAAPCQLVTGIIRRLEGLRVTVERVLTPACALAARMPATGGRRMLAISSGDEATSIAVLQGRDVLLERILPWGFVRLTERLAEELGLTAQQCRTLLLQRGAGFESPAQAAHDAMPAAVEGAPPSAMLATTRAKDDPGSEPVDRAVSEILGPLLHELTQEASGCLGYCDSFLHPVPAERAVVVGPLAAWPAFGAIIEHDLGLAMRNECAEWADTNREKVNGEYQVAACCASWTAHARGDGR
ncbi:MAG: hypothetical protein KBD56_07295 [Candidatus Eisenbacteria bacterium]|nr:hypothetical protein [Candidatus Eisenbacteria bacterium]